MVKFIFLVFWGVGVLGGEVVLGSCVWRLVDETFGRATVVFSGVPVARVSPAETNVFVGFDQHVEYRFVVGQVWKGDPGDTLTVFSPEWDYCGAGSYEIGYQYLMYVWDIHGDLEDMGSNHRNRRVELAAIDRYFLGAPVVKRADFSTRLVTADDLIGLLDHEDRRRRNDIAVELADVAIDRPYIVKRLGMILREEEAGNLVSTIVAVSKFGDDARSVVPDLINLSTSDRWRISELACDAIVQIIGKEEFFELFTPRVTSLDDKKYRYVWAKLASSYGSMNEKNREQALPKIITIIKSEKDPTRRIIAIQSLSYLWFRTNELIPFLNSIQSTDLNKNVRKAAKETHDTLISQSTALQYN